MGQEREAAAAVQGCEEDQPGPRWRVMQRAVDGVRGGRQLCSLRSLVLAWLLSSPGLTGMALRRDVLKALGTSSRLTVFGKAVCKADRHL